MLYCAVPVNIYMFYYKKTYLFHNLIPLTGKVFTVHEVLLLLELI
jgi:hypothetical protein